MGWLVNLWRIWKSAATEVFPPFLYVPGLHRTWSKQIKLQSLEQLTSKSTAGHFAKEAGKGPIDLVLDAAFYLTRDITFPKSALRESENVLRLNLDMASPIALSNLVWRNQQIGRQRGKIRFEQSVIKARTLEEIELLCDALGLRLRTIGTANGTLKPFFDNRRVCDRLIYRWFWAFGALTMLAGLTIGYMFWQDARETRQKIAVLSADLTTVREKTVVLIDTQNSMQEKSQITNDAYSNLLGQRGRGLVLAQVSTSFPEDSWVSEFEINGSQVTLGGFAGSDIVNILSALNGQAFIDDAKLDGSLSSGGASEKRRFRISATLSAVQN